jgi:hypothetical protein
MKLEVAELRAVRLAGVRVEIAVCDATGAEIVMRLTFEAALAIGDALFDLLEK